MYKLCKTEQSARRQRQLEDGLLDAMLQQRYEDISISDLCDQLNVPRKSFYRYFASKDGALHALVDHRLLEYELQASLGYSAHSRPGFHLQHFFEFWKNQHRLLDALARSGLSNVLTERAMRMDRESNIYEFHIRRGAKNFQKIATVFVTAGLMTLVIQWHRDGFQEPVEDMAAMTRVLLSRPVMPDQYLIS